MEDLSRMEEKILNYLQDSPHTWGEIVAHCGYDFSATRRALNELERDGLIGYDAKTGLYGLA